MFSRTYDLKAQEKKSYENKKMFSEFGSWKKYQDWFGLLVF